LAQLELAALPPAQAVAYFKAKGLDLDPTFSWQDKFQEDHAASFTVAKSAGFDILKDIHDAQLAAIAEGTTFETFRDRLTPILQEKGWWGRKLVEDTLTGQPAVAQLGSVSRLRTIFDVNMRTSYAAGNWAAFERNAATRPYLRYTAVLDSHTRPLHRLWHGTILPIDHPWWATHACPCGWNCRCRLVSVSEADLVRYGWKVSAAPPADPHPPTLFINKRTGERSMVPAGIDPGFAYNPGKAAVDLHAVRVAASRWTDAPPDFTAAEQAASIDFLLPKLTRDFGQWVDQVATAQAAGTAPIGDQRVIGALNQGVLDFLKARGIEPKSGAITISDRTVVHMLRDAKASRGTALPAENLRQLPDLVGDPASILFDAQDPALVYTFDDPAGAGKIVVRIDLAERVSRQTVVTNAVRTGGIVQPSDLAPPRYLPIQL
jgi:SPP1 gp7 family putative phage head morphogenesis protein